MDASHWLSFSINSSWSNLLNFAYCKKQKEESKTPDTLYNSDKKWKIEMLLLSFTVSYYHLFLKKIK